MVCRIFVGGLPCAKTEEELRERFGKVGKLLDVWVSKPKSNGSGLNRNFGYLTFATQAEGERCKKVFNKTKWLGKRIRAETANPGYMERLEAKWAEEEKMKKPEIKTRKRKLPFQNFPPPKRHKGENDSDSELDSDSEPESDVVMETQNGSSKTKCSIDFNDKPGVKGMELTEDIRCFLGSDSSDDNDDSDISLESTHSMLDNTERGEDNNSMVKLNEPKMENSPPPQATSVLYEQKPKAPIKEHSAEVTPNDDGTKTSYNTHPFKNSFVYKDTHILPEILPTVAEKPNCFPWVNITTKPAKQMVPNAANLDKKSLETNTGSGGVNNANGIFPCVSCQQELPGAAKFCWNCGAPQGVQTKNSNEEDNSLEDDANKEEEANTNDKLVDMEDGDDTKQATDSSPEYLSPVNQIIRLAPNSPTGPRKRGEFTVDFIVPAALSKKLNIDYSTIPSRIDSSNTPPRMNKSTTPPTIPPRMNKPTTPPRMNKSMCLDYTTQTPGLPETMEGESDIEDEPFTKASPVNSPTLIQSTPEKTSTTVTSTTTNTSTTVASSMSPGLPLHSMGLWNNPSPPSLVSSTEQPRSQLLRKLSKQKKKQQQRRELQKQQVPKLDTWSLLCK